LAVTAAQAPGGTELHEAELHVLAPAAAPPPVDLRLPVPKEQLPTRLDHAPVALRHPRSRATFELAAASVAGFRAALDRLGFVEIQTPKIVGSATESGANVFRLDYFGGQRLHRYEDCVRALGGHTEGYEGYLETFRHGMPPHGGFALGLERWLARLLEAPNVRETTLFPRDLNRLAP
ncbi:MAG TPA: amino acid--tRNA ligase-related protein, partial [Gaiellaceae bacterium]|nr:amino acid--tRNA ligase-related protein [Gaiellaceae bacterium]